MLTTVLKKGFASRFLPKVVVVNRSGEKIEVPFEPGDTLYKAVEDTKAQDLQGKCGGNMACGLCHCIVPKNVFTPPDDDEKDVLGDATGVCETSRLACQLELDEKFDGVEIKMGPI